MPSSDPHTETRTLPSQPAKPRVASAKRVINEEDTQRQVKKRKVVSEEDTPRPTKLIKTRTVIDKKDGCETSFYISVEHDDERARCEWIERVVSENKSTKVIEYIRAEPDEEDATPTTTTVPAPVEPIGEKTRAEIARALYERVLTGYRLSHNRTRCTSLECVSVTDIERRLTAAKSDTERQSVMDNLSQHAKILDWGLRDLGMIGGEARAMRDVDLFHECQVLVAHHNVCKGHVSKLNTPP